jgi:hypothetical protein
MTRLALALAVVIPCVGCVVGSGPNRVEAPDQQVHNREEVKTAASAATIADQTAGRTNGVTASATITYWLGIKAALRPHPIDPGAVARDIGNLLRLGVDPELVRESQLVVDKMRAASASIKSLSAVAVLFHFPRSRLAEAEALSREAFAQCQVIERMRSDLTARFGVEFPSLELPTP